jgi:hypothetical protein
MTTFERKLMLAMRLDTVEELEELLVQPVSQWAADHSAPPDEEFELTDRLEAEADRHWIALQFFNTLSGGEYRN